MIGIITYDNPHRKTQDLIWQLIAKGHKDITVIATPFVSRKNFVPIYAHRPSKAIDISITDLCNNLDIHCIKSTLEDLHQTLSQNQFEHIILAGAGILPPEIAINHKIINAHPGYLPLVKGLDALKWAIYQDITIGVTSHYISDKTDEGILIERKEVSIFSNDTFHSIAYRQYEMEIQMLADSIDIINNGLENISLADDTYTAHRRMPHRLEKQMMKKLTKKIKSLQQ